MRKGVAFAAAVAAAVAAAGCGPAAITVGSRPFPARHPVFSDASGNALESLPPAAGRIRIVFLDFPWCPACADVRRAVRLAAKPFPAGTVRVYRILFDRETSLSAAGPREVPPFRTPPSPDGDDPGEPGSLEITTLTALPGPFRKEFHVSHGPVLLLLDDAGNVEKRWIGFSTGMSGELSSEFRKRSLSPSPRPPGT